MLALSEVQHHSDGASEIRFVKRYDRLRLLRLNHRKGLLRKPGDK